MMINLTSKSIYQTLLLCVCTFLLVSCQGRGSRPAPIDARELSAFTSEELCGWQTGDEAAGIELFNQKILAGVPGCVTCHSIKKDENLVGPSMYGIAYSAAVERQQGVLPANYLYLSIIVPNQYIVDGYQADVMPHEYGTKLTQVEITNIVTYLMTFDTY